MKVSCNNCVHKDKVVRVYVKNANNERIEMYANRCLATEEQQMNIFGNLEYVYNTCQVVNKDGECRLYEKNRFEQMRKTDFEDNPKRIS